MKRTIKLTESDLHNIIKESVNQIIRENNDELKLTGDYTDEEKAKQEKRKKSSERAKKSAETRAINKSKKDKEAEDRLMKQQRERGYKGLFEGSYDDNSIVYGMWTNIVEQLGVENVLNSIVNYASTDQLKEWIEWLQQDYELDLELDNMDY
jgi:hypothetical protein